MKTENGEKYPSGGLRIPYEVADGITLACLKDQLEYLQKELKDHLENGQYMHPEDVYMSQNKLIPALETLIKYFGG